MGEQSVVKCVDVLKAVGGIAFCVFGVDAHVVVQEAVEAEVFEAYFLLDD
jgi:hypothetical protein